MHSEIPRTGVEDIADDLRVVGELDRTERGGSDMVESAVPDDQTNALCRMKFFTGIGVEEVAVLPVFARCPGLDELAAVEDAVV